MQANRDFHILLVEDDPADAYLAQIAFQDAAITARLTHVTDGIEALEYLQDEGQAQPDLILLDLNMPRMDGRAFLAQAKADPLLRCIPIVVLSTSNAASDIRAAYRDHASGYVVKPLTLDDLIIKLTEVTRYWMSTVCLWSRTSEFDTASHS